jgi:hypothetical protein
MQFLRDSNEVPQVRQFNTYHVVSSHMGIISIDTFIHIGHIAAGRLPSSA